jgi:hypothetical protein
VYQMVLGLVGEARSSRRCDNALNCKPERSKLASAAQMQLGTAWTAASPLELEGRGSPRKRRHARASAWRVRAADSSHNQVGVIPGATAARLFGNWAP